MPDVGTSSSRPTPLDGYRTSLDPPLCRLNRGGIPEITLMVSGQRSLRDSHYLNLEREGVGN